MSGYFSNKVAFITGASSGIGAATAIACAREGADVVLVARRVDRLAEVAATITALGSRALVVQGDVTDRGALDAAVGKAVEAFGGIDVVVANAGFGVEGRVESLTVDDFRRQFETNFFG